MLHAPIVVQRFLLPPKENISNRSVVGTDSLGLVDCYYYGGRKNYEVALRWKLIDVVYFLFSAQVELQLRLALKLRLNSQAKHSF